MAQILDGSYHDGGFLATLQKLAKAKRRVVIEEIPGGTTSGSGFFAFYPSDPDEGLSMGFLLDVRPVETQAFAACMDRFGRRWNKMHGPRVWTAPASISFAAVTLIAVSHEALLEVTRTAQNDTEFVMLSTLALRRLGWS